MKIDTDLRLAIRSAIAVQKLAKQNSWQERRDREKAAIDELIQRRNLKPKVKAAKKQLDRIEVSRAKVALVFNELGISSELDYIRDDTKFIKAGGKLIPPLKSLNFDGIMAELAAADPKQADHILKKLNIKWSKP